MNIFDVIEKYVSYALLGLMVIVVVFSTFEVGYEIIANVFEPPGFVFGVADLFELFGLFLMVLIGLELMTAIRMFLKEHNIHAELMLLVAITAITRKVVILDAKVIDPITVFAIGFLVIALCVGYYLISRARAKTAAAVD